LSFKELDYSLLKCWLPERTSSSCFKNRTENPNETGQLVDKTAHLFVKGRTHQRSGRGLTPAGTKRGTMTLSEFDSNSSREPELRLLMASDTFEPLWKSLSRQLNELCFPKKLPPLSLESKPQPVKDIWGFYNYKKNGVLGSTGVHILIAAIIVAGTVTWRHPKPAPIAKVPIVLVIPNDIPDLKPGKTLSGGGGGGGDHDLLKASVGKLPPRSLQQITPPVVVLRSEHPRLAVESAIVIPPEVTLVAFNHFPDVGDPMSHATRPSNGQGQLGGIGDTGSRGGIGPGEGPGYGPGKFGGNRRRRISPRARGKRS
jgi:hypothetical protein